jgi:hypothetical protein
MCNAEDSIVIDLVCVSYSTLFQSDLMPHLQSMFSNHASAMCSGLPLGGTLEHEALAWVGYKLWRWGNNLLCQVYYFEFFDFFSSLGRTRSESWMTFCTGEDMARLSAKSGRFEIVHAGNFNFNKATKWIYRYIFLINSNTHYSTSFITHILYYMYHSLIHFIS